MMTSSQVIEKIPIEYIWNEDGDKLEYERAEYLPVEAIKKLLKKYPIKFIIARIGQPLKFIPEEECYTLWNQEVRDHMMDPPKGHLFLPDQLDGYGYLASKWQGSSDDDWVIVLEDYG